MFTRCYLFEMPNEKCKVVANQSENTEAMIKVGVNWTIPHTLKACSITCSSCGAFHWLEEATVDEANKWEKSFSQCCQKNKVTLPLFHDSAIPYPDFLRKRLTGKSKGEIMFHPQPMPAN
jgi:hypothetical protein